jgi:hypothetical protein
VTWVLVAVGGSAVLGAGASYLGSKKQSDASKAAANLQMDQFGLINQQQQPFIQSGYGAMGRLNTLLGLNPNPRASAPGGMQPGMQAPDPGYMPTPGGGVQPIMQVGQPRMQIPERGPNVRLNQLLMMRAANGDRQAQAMLQRMS